MKILILGGTNFIGRYVAESFLAGGHDVTILNRGQTKDELPSSITRLRGDRDGGVEGLKALEGGTWDACIDVSGYIPRQVRPSANLLRDRIGRYVFISAVRVYGDPDRRPVRETDPLEIPAAEDITEIDDQTYGPLKVTCEKIVEEIYGERSTILRPQVVVGPLDRSGRYTYWINRAAAGGKMLAPGDGSDHIQVIDVRDLAAFTVRAIEKGLSGAFNVAGPRLSWAKFMETIGAKDYVWVDSEIIRSAALGFNEMPLYRPERGYLSSLMDVSNERAIAVGLTLTPPGVTAHDTREWSLGAGLTPALSSEKEAELIKRARQKL